ncbi:MAG: hypothetical protein V4726_06480 [Verrucomicrobiota bacterium]
MQNAPCGRWFTAKSQRPPGGRMSGYGMESGIARTRDAGFRLPLVKPVRLRALEEAIQQITRRTSNN